MRFYTAMNPPPIVPHPACKETYDHYDEFSDKNGKVSFKLVESINFHEKIQEASKASLTVKEYMSKYGLKMQDLPQAQIQDIIDDYTEMPQTYSEAANAIAKAKNAFSLLSPDQKAMFNNNPLEFLASAQNGTADDKLNLKQPVVEQKVNTVLQKPDSVPVDATNKSSIISEGVKYE